MECQGAVVVSANVAGRRHVDAVFAQRRERAERHRVAAGEQRIRRRFARIEPRAHRVACTNERQIGYFEVFDRRAPFLGEALMRSEEHTSELQSLMRISYAVFCLKKET